MSKSKNISISIALILLVSFFKVEGQTSPSTVQEPEGSRQVHLDFHTSEEIQDIGKHFDKRQFQEALKTGGVNSINIFAKGHHGWTYYPSKVGEQHPHLDFDLLGAQIEACHEIGVTAQAYITVGWSAKDAREHPEWIRWDRLGKKPRTIEERKADKPDAPFGWGWDNLSPEGAYKQHILDLTREICENYDVDGLWYDIIPVWNINYSPLALEDMKSKGIDPEDKKAVRAYHSAKMNEFMADVRSLMKSIKPEATLFFNWSTHMYSMETFDYRFFDHNTKMDLEDLPTTWAGYDKFPLRAKYFANEGKPVVAMSGKFHKAWGEFGGFKDKKAILYEAAAMVSFGAAVNFGDQLHPSGLMDLTTYQNIGYAYDYIEQIEDYGVGADHFSNLGLWMVPSQSSNDGVVKMLLEGQVNFVVTNNLEDWSDLETIIIPGFDAFTKEELQRLKEFESKGGKLLLLGRAGLNEDKTAFLFNTGLQYTGRATADIDYAMSNGELKGVITSPFLNYTPAERTKITNEVETLVAIREPYFNRTLRHYSSHRNTPYKLTNADHPGLVLNGNVLYSAWDLGKIYDKNGAKVHRDLFLAALKSIHKTPVLEVELQSSGRVNLLHQPDQNRYIAHLLYASPVKRGDAEVIEDLLPVFNTRVTLKVDQPIKKVRLVPSDKELDFRVTGSVVEVILPEFTCHSALVFDY